MSVNVIRPPEGYKSEEQLKLDLRSEYPKADFWGSILRSEQLADTLAPSF